MPGSACKEGRGSALRLDDASEYAKAVDWNELEVRLELLAPARALIPEILGTQTEAPGAVPHIGAVDLKSARDDLRWFVEPESIEVEPFLRVVARAMPRAWSMRFRCISESVMMPPMSGAPDPVDPARHQRSPDNGGSVSSSSRSHFA